MKKVTKFFMAALLAGMCSFGYAQTYEWKKPPKLTEKEIGMVTNEMDGYWVRKYDEDGTIDEDRRRVVPDEVLYESLLQKAEAKYGKTYPKFALRNFKSTCTEDNKPIKHYNPSRTSYFRIYQSSATVVIPDAEIETNENLTKVLDKALRNVSGGSRLAIDQITVTSSMDRENLKDQLIDVLLEKGYRVVAKEYLQKLYEEQKDQESGLYNPDTKVEGSKFSAVGYFINVKVTESSIRVQVVNVSTGEYEGNATINF